jgi:hypothetical protein
MGSLQRRRHSRPAGSGRGRCGLRRAPAARRKRSSSTTTSARAAAAAAAVAASPARCSPPAGTTSRGSSPRRPATAEPQTATSCWRTGAAQSLCIPRHLHTSTCTSMDRLAAVLMTVRTGESACKRVIKTEHPACCAVPHGVRVAGAPPARLHPRPAGSPRGRRSPPAHPAAQVRRRAAVLVAALR